MSDLFITPDGEKRCSWSSTAPEFIEYHDNEWGFPVGDDRQLFEKICLECFQCGLSWRTILAKRESFRRAFQYFDIDKVALYTEDDVTLLLENKSIIRHRGKIEAVVNNAKCAQRLIKEEGSLAAFFWRYEPIEDPMRLPQSVTTSDESIALSKALKKKGWKFVGPTTIYAFFQAMGLINDHSLECTRRKSIALAREVFIRPA